MPYSYYFSCFSVFIQLGVGRVHQWVGFGRVGWVIKFSVLGGSGWVGSSVKNI